MADDLASSESSLPKPRDGKEGRGLAGSLNRGIGTTARVRGVLGRFRMDRASNDRPKGPTERNLSKGCGTRAGQPRPIQGLRPTLFRVWTECLLCSNPTTSQCLDSCFSFGCRIVGLLGPERSLPTRRLVSRRILELRDVGHTVGRYYFGNVPGLKGASLSLLMECLWNIPILRPSYCCSGMRRLVTDNTDEASALQCPYRCST